MAEEATCEGEHRGEDDVDSGAVDVEHDPEVDGDAAQHGEEGHEGPIGRVQRDLEGGGGGTHQNLSWTNVCNLDYFCIKCGILHKPADHSVALMKVCL